ncbi:hypothetical protein F8388_019382 [Cannabis sativa]|uniref:Uncharacterized protein n=1 Tax=Cannabis sativa TaxID=3483 RepID=A0A7J6FFN5_CANSA|nr:hypothetical protein F8388_019382 [Cannabis sativa]
MIKILRYTKCRSGSSPSPKITITKNISNSIGSSPSPSNFSKFPTQQNNKPQNLNPRRHPQQPSVVEIKHAIDAGRFCEPIPSIELEEVKNMKFNVRMMNFSWVFEHPLQKKIRESDESITDQIERKFRLNGIHFLFFSCKARSGSLLYCTRNLKSRSDGGGLAEIVVSLLSRSTKSNLAWGGDGEDELNNHGDLGCFDPTSIKSPHDGVIDLEASSHMGAITKETSKMEIQ